MNNHVPITYHVMAWLFQYDRNIICLSTALLRFEKVSLFFDPVIDEFGCLRYALDRLQVYWNIRASNQYPNEKFSC